ncbi:hypothetical protein J6590_093221 [Homalodisca vitripennis]|nr:hypothetical protein J6590_093221 [Homalodisca vitripennis]
MVMMRKQLELQEVVTPSTVRTPALVKFPSQLAGHVARAKNAAVIIALKKKLTPARIWWCQLGKPQRYLFAGDEMKKKWKNMRDCYMKYLRDCKTTTGQAKRNYKKWTWATQLERFKPFIGMAKTMSNVTAPEIEGDNTNSDEFVDEPDELVDDGGHKTRRLSMPVGLTDTNTLKYGVTLSVLDDLKIEAVPNEMLREPSVIFRRGSIFVSSKKDVISKTLFSEPKYGM